MVWFLSEFKDASDDRKWVWARRQSGGETMVGLGDEDINP